MRTSETCNDISAAMAAAQGAMKPAIKDATNPHFKSKYADLASVFEAVREPFAKNGLSVWQELGNAEGGVTVTTRLVHKSGQWVEFGPLFVPALKHDAQGIGSAATYARRYSLAAALGVCADEDDDGNAASAGNGKAPAKTPAPVNAPSWAIKSEGPEDFIAKMKEKIAKAPNIEALGKLNKDNEPTVKTLTKAQFDVILSATDERAMALSQTQQAAQ